VVNSRICSAEPIIANIKLAALL